MPCENLREAGEFVEKVLREMRVLSDYLVSSLIIFLRDPKMCFIIFRYLIRRIQIVGTSSIL